MMTASHDVAVENVAHDASGGGGASPASDLSGDWNDCDTQASPDKVEILKSAFEQGIWVTHLADQANHAAPVQGVRFFYAPTSPVPVGQRSDRDGILLGHFGYVTLLPETVQVDEETGNLKLSLSLKKTWLQDRKAWEATGKHCCTRRNSCSCDFYAARTPKRQALRRERWASRYFPT